MNVEVPWLEWMLGAVEQSTIGVNRITKMLMLQWRKLSPELISGISPLMTFIWHPLFREIWRDGRYENWKMKEVFQFRHLGKGRQIYAREDFLQQKIEDTPRFVFQYQRMRSITSKLMKNDNIFRPFFENLVITMDKRKLLSRICIVTKCGYYREGKTEVGKGYALHLYRRMMEESENIIFFFQAMSLRRKMVFKYYIIGI